ncbi:hypothetical protein FACS189456_7330 [Bacteroidia bacterium]|nr:hypothetical protein FACS189456_7330 [Bacteroidia bacterium]
MGAGKTTLIKEICAQLGVVDTVTSPTFALINEYQCSNGTRIAHFDFYRLKNIEEALQLGVEEYFDSTNICLIEWPELVESLLPDDAVRLHLSVTAQGTRQISNCGSGSI